MQVSFLHSFKVDGVCACEDCCLCWKEKLPPLRVSCIGTLAWWVFRLVFFSVYGICFFIHIQKIRKEEAERIHKLSLASLNFLSDGWFGPWGLGKGS